MAICSSAISDEQQDSENISEDFSSDDALCMLQTHVHVHLKTSTKPDLPASRTMESAYVDDTQLMSETNGAGSLQSPWSQLDDIQLTVMSRTVPKKSVQMHARLLDVFAPMLQGWDCGLISAGIVFTLVLVALFIATTQLALLRPVKGKEDRSFPLRVCRWLRNSPEKAEDKTHRLRNQNCVAASPEVKDSAAKKTLYCNIADQESTPSVPASVALPSLSAHELSMLKKTLTCQVCTAVEACRCVKETHRRKEPLAEGKYRCNEQKLQASNEAAHRIIEPKADDNPSLIGCSESYRNSESEAEAAAPAQESLVDSDSAAALDAARHAVFQAVTLALQERQDKEV